MSEDLFEILQIPIASTHDRNTAMASHAEYGYLPGADELNVSGEGFCGFPHVFIIGKHLISVHTLPMPCNDCAHPISNQLIMVTGTSAEFRLFWMVPKIRDTLSEIKVATA